MTSSRVDGVQLRNFIAMRRDSDGRDLTSKRLAVPLQACAKMLDNVAPVMSAGIDVELVLHLARIQQSVHGAVAGVETVTVVGAYIEVDRHVVQGRRRLGSGIG